MRPTTIYDTLNPQGEQEDEECRQEGIQDDPQFVAYDHQGNFDEPTALPESYKYKSIEVPKKKELFSMTRMLGEEQALVLDQVLNHCRLYFFLLIELEHQLHKTNLLLYRQ